MARDLNQLFESLRSSRPVYVTPEGTVESEDEARRNDAREERRTGSPRPRTRLKPEVFGASPPRVRVDLTVLGAMMVEAGRHDGETGGILVGPDDDTVTELIPSGARAERTPTSYRLDVDHLQPLLEKAEDRGLRFLGIWHVHPAGVHHLSGTDLAAARSILRDPEWNIAKLLLPLSVRRGEGIETRFFLASGTEPTIEPVEVTTISTSVEERSTSKDRPREGPRTVPPPSARIDRDCAVLRKDGWVVEVRKTAEDETVLALANGRVRLFLVLPPEYPSSPPDLFVEEKAPFMLPHEEIPEVRCWSSRRELDIVARQAEGAILRRRVANGKRSRRSVRDWLQSFFLGASTRRALTEPYHV